MRKIKFINKIVVVFVGLLILTHPVFAQEDIKELKKQIETLQKRVEELESSKAQQQKEKQREKDGWGFFNRRRDWGEDPFDEMDRIQNEMSRMFQNSFSKRGNLGGGMFSSNMSFDSDFDMKETKEGYEIRFNMKGLNQEKVDVDINKHSITIKGEHSKQDTEENENTYFSSQSYGSFMKTIPLPVDADTTNVKTEKEGDDLVIKMPKKAS